MVKHELYTEQGLSMVWLWKKGLGEAVGLDWTELEERGVAWKIVFD